MLLSLGSAATGGYFLGTEKGFVQAVKTVGVQMQLNSSSVQRQSEQGNPVTPQVSFGVCPLGTPVFLSTFGTIGTPKSHRQLKPVTIISTGKPQ